MLVQGKYMIVAAGARVVHAVPEPAYPVIHGDGHVINFVIPSIIIAQCLHSYYLQSFMCSEALLFLFRDGGIYIFDFF